MSKLISDKTRARILVASELYEMHTKLNSMFMYICLSKKDISDIQIASDYLGDVVNRVMKAEKSGGE